MSDIIDLIPKLKNYYFTFGFGHEHEGCYTAIKAQSSLEARNKMFKKYGRKWAFQYNSVKEAGVEEYNLKYI